MENETIKENKSAKLDKIMKLSIIFGVLIVALSIAYYLVVFLPLKNKEQWKQEEEKQKMTQECSNKTLDDIRRWAEGRQVSDDNSIKQYNFFFEKCLKEKGL
ncbi:MAG: hypothetical protein NT136_04240 [Candidatus Moranbacteria bacterium]|nr:hypothetical protein [Candidatus Moranbacteria bacterium]